VAANGASPRGETALITALLAGKTAAEAAQGCGLSERTVSRRLADPRFQQQLAQARQRVLSRAVHVLVDGTTSAAATLRWLAGHADQEHVRLAAARAVLDAAWRGVEVLDLAGRIAALEGRVTEPEGSWPRPVG